MSDERGTGRTTRMMDAATAAAESGVRVLVLAANHQHAEILRRHWPKVPVQTVERRPSGMDCVLWEDHYARETYEMLRGEAIRRAAILSGVRAGLEAAKALAGAAWEAYDTEWRDAFTVEYARDMEMKKDCIGDLRGQIDGVDAESIAKEAEK